MPALTRRLLKAEVIYNGLGTPRAGGAVVVQGEGEEAVIVAVDDAETASRNFPDASIEHVGFALSPAPVNAHLHLDLSTVPHFTGVYEDFIRHVIGHSGAHRGVAAAKAGVAELKAQGLTVIGDIVAHEAVMRYLLTEPDMKGVAYWEVAGPNPDDEERVFSETVERLQRFKALERPGGVRVGLSPHTPHTVSAGLLRRLALLARQERLPMQIHVAESPYELPFHKDGSGPLMALMRPFLPHWQPSGLSPVAYLESLGVLEARPTLVHMVQVTEDDVRKVQRAGAVVVHCPRSNLGLGCGRFSWELYMKHGVEVAIGTDSRASSPDLSVVAEVRAALKLHGERASPLALVRSAVKGGYRALQMTPPHFSRGDKASALYLWDKAVQ